MIFHAPQNPELRVYPSRLGRALAFHNGQYETTDLAEIRVLKRHPLVVEAGDVLEPAPVAEPDPGPDVWGDDPENEDSGAGG